MHAAAALVLPIVTIVIWFIAVGWPLATLMGVLPAVPASSGAGESFPEFHSQVELLLTSLGWALATAVVAGLTGWVPGRVLGKALQSSGGGFIVLAALALVPICVPSYVVFYAWWQGWPPESALHQWILAHGSMQLGREATLLLSLACWSWPLVALCVAGAASRRPRERDEMLLIDGASWRVRSLDNLRTDLPGLLLGMLLVALATLSNTTCFDLAQVFTFANELRARAALGRPPDEILRAGWPMLAIAAAGALVVWRRLRARANGLASRGSAPSGSVAAGGAVVWLATVIVPLALFWRGMVAEGGDVGGAVREFGVLYRINALTTLALAGAAAAVAALAGLGLAVMWHSDRAALRLLAHIMSITWLLMALLPATISGLALQAAYHRGALAEMIYSSPVILIIAHLASAGFVAALLARWSAASEPRVLHDLRRLDGAFSPLALWRTARPALLACTLATFAIVWVLAVGEIAITAQVQPPMPIESTPLGPILLDAMHYQRPMTVLVGAVLMLSLALLAAIAAAVVWSVTAKRHLTAAGAGAG